MIPVQVGEAGHCCWPNQYCLAGYCVVYAKGNCYAGEGLYACPCLAAVYPSSREFQPLFLTQITCSDYGRIVRCPSHGTEMERKACYTPQFTPELWPSCLTQRTQWHHRNAMNPARSSVVYHGTTLTEQRALRSVQRWPPVPGSARLAHAKHQLAPPT